MQATLLGEKKLHTPVTPIQATEATEATEANLSVSLWEQGLRKTTKGSGFSSLGCDFTIHRVKLFRYMSMWTTHVYNKHVFLL